MAGDFSVSGTRLVLRSANGCRTDGTYSWALEDEVLTLTKVSETCPDRDVQFSSLEKWSIVHQLGEQLENGQVVLLADGQHVANFHGLLDVTGSSAVAIEATLSVKEGIVFSPTILTGSPGQRITVTITNPKDPGTEDVDHDFRVDEQGIEVTVPYGGSATATVTLPQSGALRFYCGIHIRANQQGEFLVK